MKVYSNQVTETVAPTVEPVTVDEAKEHLRVDISDDDTLIGSMIAAARQWAENYTGRAFVPRTYRADLPAFSSGYDLPHPPIMSLEDIKYYDTASPSVQQTLDSGTYQVVNDEVVIAWGESVPSVYPRMDTVQITYMAGYDPGTSPLDASAVPDAVKAAILLVVGDLYENREAKIVGIMHSENPTAKMLLQAYRVFA